MHRRTCAPLVAVALLLGMAIAPFGGSAAEITDPYFLTTWERADKPVVEQQASRGWTWGNARTDAFMEQYDESPGGQRKVQYFDKARMEITYPDAPDDTLWYVSTGLLVSEMVTGQVQVGDASFVPRESPAINVAGDLDDPDGPTYRTVGLLMDDPAEPQDPITRVVQRDGVVGADPNTAAFGVTSEHYVSETGHWIASVFWQFVNAVDVVYEDDQYVIDRVFEDPFYGIGFPLMDAHWTRVSVGGVEQYVLFQCFQRRCLTYTPTNPAGWQVEMGNVGEHYQDWRYGDVPPGPPPEPSTALLFAADLSGGAEVPAVAAPGNGRAALYLAPDLSAMLYQVDVTATENITAAHIHLGWPGQTGPVVATLFDGEGAAWTPAGPLVADTFSAADLTGPLAGKTLDDLRAEIAAGHTYVNVHTSAHPQGELRGQLGVAAEVLYRSAMTRPADLVPPESHVRGTGYFLFNAESATIDYQLNGVNLANVSAAHIHAGGPSANGDVVAPLFAGSVSLDAQGGVLATGVLDASDLTGPFAGQPLERLAYEMMVGLTYVNVHTSANPAGEVRGQVARWTAADGGSAFIADLSGAGEEPPVATAAGGSAVFRWNVDGTLGYDLIVHDLSGATAAHIHLGAAGQTGPVSVPLFAASAETPAVGDGRLAHGLIRPGDVGETSFANLLYQLAVGGAYVNVHTAAHPNGEIRGQVVGAPGEVFLAELSGAREVPAVTTAATGWALFAVSASGQSMDYRVIVTGLTAVTGAHLHLGEAEETGPVIVTLFAPTIPPTVSGLLAEGTFDKDALEGPLTGSPLSDLLAAILAGDVYVNVHTRAHPGGEIRGQLP